jgi:acetoin utilization protein AcuB
MMRHPSTVGDLMTPCPVAIRPDQSLACAHALMRSHRVHHLPVVEEGRVVGVVSQGDLRLLESIGDVEIDQVPVEEAMIHHPYTVWADTPLAEVLQHMLARRLGSALVVDRQGLAGIFTAFDAMLALKELTSPGEGS